MPPTAQPRFHKTGPAIWALVGAAVAVLVGLWLVLTREPASLEHAAPIATPPAAAPAPMPQPRPAS